MLRLPMILRHRISGYSAWHSGGIRRAASPMSSSMRSSARPRKRSCRNASAWISETSSRASRATSSMSWRFAASRSPGFIQRFQIGKYCFPAERIPQDLRAGELDLAVIEQGGEVVLHRRIVPEGSLACRIELQHQIDIALRIHLAARGRAEEGELLHAVFAAQRRDFLLRDAQPAGADGVFRLRLLQHRRSRAGRQDLRDDAAQLVEDGRAAIGLVVLLVAEPADRHQAGRGKALELALHRAHARARGAHDLVRVETTLRMAEQEAQHSALRFREQRVGQGRRLRSHIGNDSSQYGCLQPPVEAGPEAGVRTGAKCATLHASMNPAATVELQIPRSISREDMAKLPIRRYEGKVCLVA